MPGDRLVFPDGGVGEVVRSPADPQKDALEFRFTLVPGGTPPPPHVHPRQTETFEVLEGEIEVTLGRVKQRLAAGAKVSVPPGTVHTFRNAGPGPAVVRDVHEPGLSFERYLRRFATLAEEGKLKPPPHPVSILRIARLLAEHRDTMLPPPRQRGAFQALDGLARLLRVRV